MGRDAEGNRRSWLLPAAAAAIQAEELQGCGGSGGSSVCGDSGRRSSGQADFNCYLNNDLRLNKLSYRHWNCVSFDLPVLTRKNPDFLFTDSF